MYTLTMDQNIWGSVVTEGANMDLAKIKSDFKKWKKESGPSVIKKLYNEGEYEKCRKKIAEGIKVCDDYEKMAMKIEGGVISAITGGVYACILEFVKLCIVSLLSFGIGSIVVALRDYNRNKHALFKIHQNSKESNWGEDNDYKVLVVRAIQDVRRALKEVDKECVKALSTKDDDEKKESAEDTISIEDMIVESMENGVITDEEAEMLVEALM